jgi:hypothetical protein
MLVRIKRSFCNNGMKLNCNTYKTTVGGLAQSVVAAWQKGPEFKVQQYSLPPSPKKNFMEK